MNAYDLECMANTTPKERFASLFRMQKLTNIFHKQPSHKRDIIIRHGYFK